MIQRIQTLYLALGVILLTIMAFLPWGEIVAGERIFQFSIKGITDSQSGSVIHQSFHLLVLFVIILAVQFVTIFLYKKRVLQMRIATFNILIMMGFLIIAWFFVRGVVNKLEGSVAHFNIDLIFPLVVGMLNYIAIRAIGRDEALVRSVDRIR